MPIGIKLIGFADDVAIVAEAMSEEALMNSANSAIMRIIDWMMKRGLDPAPEKTEAVLLTTRGRSHQSFSKCKVSKSARADL